MDDQMRRSLLNKKSANFDKQYQDCLIKIQRIKQKNDFMQKQIGTDIQQSIKQQVSKQKQFIQKQIKQLKTLMDDLDKKFKDPQSKNKLKNLKTDAQKQIQRNKIILKDLINNYNTQSTDHFQSNLIVLFILIKMLINIFKVVKLIIINQIIIHVEEIMIIMNKIIKQENISKINHQQLIIILIWIIKFKEKYFNKKNNYQIKYNKQHQELMIL